MQSYSADEKRTQTCPNCADVITMRPYDIGSGPEMSCPHCEWCWGADGQDLRPLDFDALRAEIEQEMIARVDDLANHPFLNPPDAEGYPQG